MEDDTPETEAGPDEPEREEGETEGLTSLEQGIRNVWLRATIADRVMDAGFDPGNRHDVERLIHAVELFHSAAVELHAAYQNGLR